MKKDLCKIILRIRHILIERVYFTMWLQAPERCTTNVNKTKQMFNFRGVFLCLVHFLGRNQRFCGIWAYMYYSVTVLWWVLKFFGSDFSDISFSYSSLSIKILINFIILDAIGWKSGTRKCNRIQKGQALNCMRVLGCAIYTGKINFIFFL